MPPSSNGSIDMKSISDGPLATAIVQTVAYVDVFDYPLRPAEVHRYLIGMAAPRAKVEQLLANGALVPRRLARHDDYLTLPGRQQIVETRRRREAIARRLWPFAIRYGRLIAALPFVRMVAVTGSLAVNNAEGEADIDYLIITANDRLWLSRAFIILIVRLAALRNVHLCPNYLLSERALLFSEQNLYTAHELAQMIPLSGQDVYGHIRHLNRWAEAWLPNAISAPPPAPPISAAESAPRKPLQGILERGLGGSLGGRLEKWERERKLAKFKRQTAESRQAPGSLEVHFSADWCKGHFEGHAGKIMRAFDERVQHLGIGE